MISFPAMTDQLSPAPQFGTAEYGSSGDRCALCKQPIGPSYFRVNQAMVCPSCADRVRQTSPQDSHSAFVRAIAAGSGAAVAGMIGYALLTIILQGWVISYMSFAVGWLVGMAMIKASGGIGGRRYQIAAVLLTYAAVSMAAIPTWIYYANEHKTKSHAEQQQVTSDQSPSDSESGQTEQEQPAPQRKPLSLGTWLGRVIMLGLASPFIELQGNSVWGILGLFILFIGLRIAWRITAGRTVPVLGPFENTPIRT